VKNKLFLLFAALIAIESKSDLKGEKLFVHYLSNIVSLSPTVKTQLELMADNGEINTRYKHETLAIERSLFNNFPALSSSLGFIELAHLPTPILHAESLGQYFHMPNIFIKRDDLTGKILDNNKPLFGGNKIRKLEFLLGDALLHGAETIITHGCAGSNHAVATAACAHYLDLNTILILKPQTMSEIVERNLKLMHAYRATMLSTPNNEIRSITTISQYIHNKYEHGDFPYVIPTGGSCPIGVLGYINAAFELKDQIAQGIIPEPDFIYASASSSSGATISGLLLGAKAAGLHTKIMGIAIEPEDAHEIKQNIIRLFNEANELLHKLDASFPLYTLTQDEININLACSGTEYGLVTPEGRDAIKLLKARENIQLDDTYTSKVFDGMIRDIQAGNINKNAVVLYWHTFCGLDFSSITDSVKVSDLPKSFHRYFAR
jgi:1-aminocyclopropane-1-carboxylate deaminase/D-cysteine desulfhydrase-like pyridoxal-dependent ACC family enzyme